MATCRALLVCVLALGGVGCANEQPVATPPPTVTFSPQTASPLEADAPAATAASTGTREAGVACSSGDQCTSGVCEGKGCGPDEAKCAPKARSCTRDRRKYCGCDGKTFRSSGTCPRRPFAHRGACP